MLAIRSLVKEQNYTAISQQVIKMKDLWLDKNLDGLLRRREEEAALVQNAGNNTFGDQLIRV